MSPHEILAANTHAVMVTLNMSQQDVADEVGVSRPLVSTWVRAKNKPDINQAAALARAFNVPIDALISTAPEEITPEWLEKVRKVFTALNELGLDEAYRRLIMANGKTWKHVT